MAFRGLVAMCNLLLGEFNVLKNRYLHVDWKEDTAHSLPKQHIEQHIGAKKQPIRQIRDSQGQCKDPK